MANTSVKINADLSELQNALNKCNSSLKIAKSNFEMVKSEVGKFSNNEEKLGKVIEAQGKIVDENTNKVKLLEQQLTKLESAETKDEKQIAKVTDQLNRAKTELNNNVTKLKEYQSQQEKNTSALGNLNNKISENKTKLQEAKEKYQSYILEHSKNSEGAKVAQNEIKKLSEELNRNQKELEESANATNKYDNSLSNINTDSAKEKIFTFKNALSGYIANIATEITKKLVSTLTNEIKSMVSTGMGFENAFAGVSKVVSGTTEEMQDLKKEIRETALEKPISQDQLASIYQMGAQLGIARKDLKDFSDTIIDLANTSNLTTEAGATMIAQYANVMHLPSEDYRRFASTLSLLGSTTATTENDIMNLMSRMSGAGATIGIAHQDLLALATAMGSVGINAEAGGSAISTILSNIDKAVDINGETLKVWADVANMTTEQFKIAWEQDTMGAIKAVIKGMGDAKVGGESLNIMLEELGISNIRQTDTMKKLANASDLLSDCMQKANGEWEKASYLGDAASNVYSTTVSQLQLLKNSYNEVKISIFECLQEPINNAMKQLKILLNDPQIKQSIVNLASQIGKTLTNILKNMDKVVKVINVIKALIIGLILTFTVSKIVTQISLLYATFKTLTSGITLATMAQNALNTAMATNPFGMVVAAIGLVITALAGLVVGIGNHINVKENETNKIIENTRALQEEHNQMLENKEAREKECASIDSEYGYYEKLIEELKTLVDENGNVKKGYEDRVNAIIPILSNATGQEIKLINNQITGYNNLIKTLDQVIQKKRAEAKINAYQGDYEEAIKSQDEYNERYAKNKEELSEKMKQLANTSKTTTSKGKGQKVAITVDNPEYKILSNQIDALMAEQKELQGLLKDSGDTITKYEDMYSEYYKTYEAPQVTVAVDDGKVKDAGKSIVEGFANTGKEAGKASSNALKEQTATSYQELLNQEKTYKSQLNTYLEEMKKGNSAVTYEMVSETNKNLSAVQKKIEEMNTLMNGATNKAKVSGPKIEEEYESDDEISEELVTGEAIGLKSQGIILGKGVAGEEAIELEGEGANAALSYIEAYKNSYEQNKGQITETINNRAIEQANQEAIAFQMAQTLPENVEIYTQTENFLAEQKQTSMQQGMLDNSYKVSDATVATMNEAYNQALTVDFSPIGKFICEGIARGISENKGLVASAVAQMMAEANSTCEEEEEIESPSKVFYRYGKYIDLGLANGIRDYAKNINTQMLEVSRGLQNSFDNTNASIKGNTFGSSNTNINYNFVQNNTSNKSLDTLSIYNESKSLLKRTVRDIYV